METKAMIKDSSCSTILQHDNKTSDIESESPVGLVSPEVLEEIRAVVGKYELSSTRIPSGQRLALIGMNREQVDKIWTDLKMEIAPAMRKCAHYVQACRGIKACRFGVRDSVGLGLELEKLYVGLELPAKVKIGVSGCSLCCSESYVRDIGVIGKRKGWLVTFGGNSGGRPRIGDIIAENISDVDAVALVKRCLEFYRDNVEKKVRTARFVEKVGIKAIKRAVL